MVDDRTQPAFEQLSARNHGPLIIIAAYIFLISSFLAVLVKTWTRAAAARKLIHTDWLMLVGYVFAIAQAVTLTISVNEGLGRRISDLSISELQSASKAFYAASILTLPALACAKASVILLLVSIQAPGAHLILRACYGLLGVIAAWTVAGILALAFQCGLPEPWVLGPQTCIDQYALRIGLGCVDVITDLAIIALAVFMMRPVQVSATKKAAVVAMFAIRIVVPAFTIAEMVAYNTFYNSQPRDRTWHAVGPSIWTQVALNLSIITACIPSMKRFLADIQSGLMGATISESYEMTHSSGKPAPSGGTMGMSLTSRLASRLGMASQQRSAIRSQQGKESEQSITPVDDWYGARSQAHTGKQGEHIAETESVKGLTEHAIHQRIDYHVEYEERENGDNESRMSERKAGFRF